MFALVAAVVGVVALIGIVSLISGMSTPSHQADPKPVTSSPVAMPEPTPSETATAPEDDGFTEADQEAVEDAISDGEPAETFDYLADPVTVAFAASDFNQERSPALAISDLDQIASGTGWSWELGETTLDSYRAGPYGDYFAEDSIVGESAEGFVVTMHVDDDHIDEIFISKSHSALTDEG